MSRLKLSILGNGSAVPTTFSNPSSQLLTHESGQFLFDCGEGTQMQMLKYRIRIRKLDHIFISHLHGDHFFGLIGLISTFHLYGRIKTLTIFAPADLEKLIRFQLKITNTQLLYPLIFIPLQDFNDELLIDDKEFTIKSFKLTHSIATWGFVFRENQRQLKINKEFVKQNKLKPDQIINIKEGNDFIDESGNIFKNENITNIPNKPFSYAYCSDTAYDEKIISHIMDVSLLYHEATFDNSLEQIAKEKLHSTAYQAAKIASLSNVNKLLLGHFSARFSDTSILLNEAKQIFQNTVLSEEGKTYIISNKNS